jgi:hypothetical protein
MADRSSSRPVITSDTLDNPYELSDIEEENPLELLEDNNSDNNTPTAEVVGRSDLMDDDATIGSSVSSGFLGKTQETFGSCLLPKDIDAELQKVDDDDGLDDDDDKKAAAIPNQSNKATTTIGTTPRIGMQSTTTIGNTPRIGNAFNNLKTTPAVTNIQNNKNINNLKPPPAKQSTTSKKSSTNHISTN